MNLDDGWSDDRGLYREVWDALASTPESARTHIVGTPDLDHFEKSAVISENILRSVLELGPSDDVLEIGCGIGRVGRLLAPSVHSWTGCDVSQNMLKMATEMLDGLPNVGLVLISGHDLAPIPSESIDVVYCTVVFMHLWEFDRFSYIEEAFRVLRPGGRIYVDNLTICSDSGWEVFNKHRLNNLPGQRQPHISTFSTPQEIEVYLTRAGFSRTQTRVDGFMVRGWGIK